MNMLWIPGVGIPLLIIIAGLLIWMSMQKDEKNKAARRMERKRRLEQASEQGARPGDEVIDQVSLDDIQGRWQLVSVGRNGNFAPSEAIAGSEILFTIVGNDFTIDPTDGFGTLEINSQQVPVQMDQHDHDGSLHRCIIRIRNGELEVCQAEDGQPRPTDFQPNRIDNASLTRFKRIDQGKQFAVRRKP